MLYHYVLRTLFAQNSKCFKCLHNHTAGLLQLPHNFRQRSIDGLLKLIRLLLLLLLVLLLMLTTRVTLLLVLLVLLVLLGVLLVLRVVRHNSLTTSQVHVDATRVLLNNMLQAQLITDFLDTGLDLLDVAYRVVTLANDTAKKLAWFISRMRSIPSNCTDLRLAKPIKCDKRIGQHTHANESDHAPLHI